MPPPRGIGKGRERFGNPGGVASRAMSPPLPLAAFVRLPPARRASCVPGLSAALDTVADAGDPTRRFLRYGWYAAALATGGGSARTVVVWLEDRPVLAVPLVQHGPRPLGLATVPGSYWPFRSFPVSAAADEGSFAMLADALAGVARAVRIGPAAADDIAAAALAAAAQSRGWTVLERFAGERFVLDLAVLAATGAWPRGSTLRKNRFHARHLASHGTVGWRTLGAGDWPVGFDTLAAVERASWVGQRADADAQFAGAGQGAFWRAAAADPVLAGMMRATLLEVGGTPAAYSFDLVAGDLAHAVATGYVPAFAAHSPGKLVQWHDLAGLRSGGVARVDWGMGDSGYKRVLGAASAGALVDRLLVRPGSGAAAWLVRRLARGWRLTP